MKKTTFQRALAALLAAVMLMSLISVPVFAEETGNTNIDIDYSFSTSIKYQTEYRIHNRYTTIYNTFNTPEQKTKWQKFTAGVGTAKGIVGTTGNLAVNLYTQIVGWNDDTKQWYEKVGETALNLACSYFGIQLPGPSESEKTIEAVGKMIDGVHDHLNEMENNIITELSDVVRDSDTELAKFIQDTATEAEWRTYLNAFYGVGSNFNYDAFRTNLYKEINALNTAYDDYDKAVLSGDNELISERKMLIKDKYDSLYNTLTYAISGGNYNPIDEMRSKMTIGFSTKVNDEDTICSLPRILYAYKVVSASNEGLADTAIAESCVGFALDIYNTYLLAEQCLNACYAYQLNEMQQNGKHSYTVSFNSSNHLISDSDIQAGIKTSVETQTDVTNKLVSDIAFLLNLESSYTYELGDRSEIYTIPYIEQVSTGDFSAENYPPHYGSFTDEYWCRINNDVSTGDIIYMNLMPEMFREMFKEGTFTFGIQQFDAEGKEIPALSTVTNTGVVNVIGNVGEKLTVTMYYNGVECYHLDFDIAERKYSGGMGIEDCPYLISNKKDFISGKTELEQIVDEDDGACFKLIEDIDFEGATLSPLGTLTGVFDGNGYAIYGFKMSVTSNAGLFEEVAANAQVKNLTIGGTSDSGEYLATIAAGPNYNTELIAGGICAVNHGTIENCTVSQVDIYAGRNINQTFDCKLFSFAGGIVGRNYNTIQNCLVQKSAVRASSETPQDNSPAKCYAYSGGIVGSNDGTVTNCSSLNNQIKCYTYSKGLLWTIGEAQTYCAGLVAKNNQKISNCYIYNNQLTATAHGDGELGSDIEKEAPYFAIPNDTESNNVEENVATTYVLSSISVTTDIGTTENPIVGAPPSKTHYYVGETLNLDGLIVRDNNGNEVNGYTVSGFESDQTGEQTLTVTYATGYGTTLSDTFTVTVDEVQAEDLVLFSKPSKTTYNINDTELDLNGLMLLVKYNNGTSKVLSDDEAKEYIEPFDFSNVGKATVTFAYEGLTATVEMDVICTHDNTVSIGSTDATCNQVGYTDGLYCNDCQTYVSGHEEIPTLNQHPFGNWTPYNDTQHSRSCACGETEYADHTWNEGTVTVEPTYSTAGELTKACLDCGTTQTQEIPPLEIPANAPRLTVETKNTTAGRSVTVQINLQNNPGIAGMVLTVKYNTDVMTLTEVTNGSIFNEITNAKNIVLNSAGNSTKNGTLVTLTFDVNEDAPLGNYTIEALVRECSNTDLDAVGVVSVSGTLSVIDFIYGDADGNGVVNLNDAVLIRNYLAHYDYDTGSSTVTVSDGADADGNGTVNLNDAVLLNNYLAHFDYDTGESSVVLGPRG